MYGRPQPGRRARTVSLVREELAEKLKSDRLQRKLEAEERRRSLSLGSSSMPNPKGKKTPSRGGIPTPTSHKGPEAQGEEQVPEENPSNPSQAATADGAREQEPAGPEATQNNMGSCGIDPTTAAFFLAMEKRLKESTQTSVDEMSKLFHKNIERIDSNTRAINDLRDRDKEAELRMNRNLDERDRRAEEREREMELRIKDSLSKKVDEAISSGAIAARTAVAAGRTSPSVLPHSRDGNQPTITAAGP